MKEYKKLAAKYADSTFREPYTAEDLYDAYIVGFLKAREMALEIVEDTGPHDLILQLGEEEV